MNKTLLAFALGLWSLSAMAQEVAKADETPAASEPEAKAEAPETVKAAAATEEFTPPPGFVTKKRGKLVLYCIRDSTVGTRFKTEKCYDEQQLHDYLLARDENQRDINRTRGTCSNPAICTAP